jgi:tetratricopeptide (TPR) repeat protein
MRRWIAPPLLMLLVCTAHAGAGLHYSGESYGALPSHWRGFLLDQRALRNIAVQPSKTLDASPLRVKYQKAAAALQARLDRDRKLPGDDWADLGALYVRLGEPARAVAVLREAQRAFPNHFAIAANLGTAWQLTGDLAQAAGALQQAVRLAPGKMLPAEELHLKLVRLRLKQGGPSQDLDDLFGMHYGGAKGDYRPGRLSDADRKKLPDRAVAMAQQLALWLPADGRLLWQLAELAATHGDFTSAAAMADGCVVQFGMTGADVRRRRQRLRDAADAAAKNGTAAHDKHTQTLAFRSMRPLVGAFDASALPPISARGINVLPWELFTDTCIEKPFRPVFTDYLRQLDGKQVSVTGFMYPLRDEAETGAFMFIENPVGCWYCEMPETTGIVYVEMPAGQTAPLRRGLVRVVGRLTLNGNDPEDFLYAIRDARIGPVD